ncbi:UNVERIFIED_CONTAM: hypothetical protein FKN15_043551 [Acipenser sinensis]
MQYQHQRNTSVPIRELTLPCLHSSRRAEVQKCVRGEKDLLCVKTHYQGGESDIPAGLPQVSGDMIDAAKLKRG